MNADTPAWRPMALRSALCLAGAIVGWLTHDRHHDLSTAAYMVAFLFGGWDLTRQVWDDLRHLRFDTHFLMFLVVPGSVAVGAWGEAALLLVLFSASAAMESYASGRTRREIDALLRRAPRSAHRIERGQAVEVPVETLRPGETIRILAGEQVPVDAQVLVGTSATDEASVTGESIPVPKAPGDALFGGTLNQWGVLDATVLRPAAESTLQRIIRLIRDAQEQKAPVQRFTDRFGTGYTLAVLGACAALFAYAGLHDQAPLFHSGPRLPSASYRAMTLLVVLSPCALVLSVPSAILSAIACGARQGILFRGGSAVENLASINVIALDKTGTLTTGELQVTRFECLQGNPDQLQAAALALARDSTHPLSRSVRRHLEAAGRLSEPATDSTTLPGKGVEARWQGDTFCLGNRELAESRSGALPKDHPAPPAGTTESWIASPTAAGRFLLTDTLRPEAPTLVHQLARRGVQTCILTGDREASAAAIAQAAGVQSFRAGLKPEDKVAAIQEFRSRGLRVAMVGDGVNDAPVLAAADVGIAMGARGSDAAIEQADVVLMQDRLGNTLTAHDLSVRANRIIRQNLAVSLGTMVLMGLATLGLPNLPLSLGVAAHEGSTVLVVLNSLRLLLHRPTHTRAGADLTPGAGGATRPNPTPPNPPTPPASQQEPRVRS